MPPKHIDHLFKRNPFRLDECLTKSIGCILDEIEDMQKEYGEQVSSVGEILHAQQWNGSDGITNVIVPGNFYMFIYNPLLKYFLPYYDIFPLVLVFETGDGWFRGLNFHHLPYLTRIQLIGHLMKYATTICPMTGKPTLTGQTRILFDWEKLKDSNASAFVQPIEQKYWMNRARSDFKYINPFHWALMMLLPCEQFVKADTIDVLRDTVRQIKAVGKEYLERKDPTVDVEKRLQCAIECAKESGGAATASKEAFQRRLARGQERPERAITRK